MNDGQAMMLNESLQRIAQALEELLAMAKKEMEDG